MKKIIDWIKGISRKELILGIVVFAVLVSATVAGVILYNYQQDLQEAYGEPGKKNSKKDKKEKKEDEKIEVIHQVRNISFSGTSIEKDLKITILDESSELVTGVAFKITAIKEGAEDKPNEYTDEDMDGIIHVQELDGGMYTVELHEVEHFVVKENPIKVEVKDKIEYKKVDVSAEVKKESEINTKVEETVGNKTPIEKPVTNTVTYLESKKTVTTVEKQNVSLDNFTPAYASERKHTETFGTTVLQVPEEVTLYNQGGVHSKTYTINPYVSRAEDATIQSIDWDWDNKSAVDLVKNADGSVTISALENGTVTITVKILYTSKSSTVQEIMWSVEVDVLEIKDMANSTAQLKDAQGFGLYIDNAGKTPAVLTDYENYNSFYSVKYTGWQTLDDKVYYFDENHQYVTGDQVIGSIKYSFREDGTLVEALETRGIDVSKWQANIDWKAVAGAGIDFAIIRVGYRGYTGGTLVEDEYFRKNIAGATKAGIKVGVYFFSQAVTEAEAIEEASAAIAAVKGYHLDYPIFIDTEWSGGYPNGRADKLSKADRTKVVKAFCKTVRNSGYKAGVYASKSWYHDNLYADELNEYFIWVAQYNTECNYTGKYDMWQYTSQGSVPGIKGNVDMNVCYKRE